MPSPLMTAPLRVGGAVLDPVARRLLIQDKPVRIGGRAFDLLLLLVEHRDRVVPKDEILDAVWPNLVVEENNLQVHVATLRRLLGAEAIVTISGRGYRLALPVQPLQPDVAPSAPASEAAAAAADIGNLPASAGPLIGRDTDLAALEPQVQAQPLISIVGPGGIGKTRLAIALAHRLRARFADGVWLVELAAVQQPQALWSTVGRTLGLAGSAAASAPALAAALAGRRLLLVLDNCEHLLDAAAELAAALLARAPALRIVATTQEPLHLGSEHRYSLGALDLPASAQLEAASGCGAVQLFAARALAVMPGFVLDECNVAAVVEICRRLDGIPLAIEMAAARLPLLGVQGIRERLDARLAMLTGGARGAEPRQRTLRATLEWSLGLLAEPERRLFRRLGVFVGGFGLAAVRAVAHDAEGATPPNGDDWDLLDRLGRLVDKSLVVSDGAATPRLHLLEALRAMALEEAAAAGETAELHRRHAAWLRALFERADADHVEMSNEQWLARYSLELDNLREAIHWAAGPSGDAETAVALASTSAACWFTVGLEAEALRYIDLTRSFVDEHLAAAVAARYWSGVTTLALRRTIPATRALDACDRALALFAAVHDQRQQYKHWCVRAYLCANAGDAAAARAAITQALAFEDPQWPPIVRVNRAQAESALHTICGELDRYLEAERQSARLYAAAGKTVSELVALSNVADAQLALGQPEAAVLTVREVIARRGALRLPPTAASTHVLTAALIAQGELDEATGIAAEAVQLARASGTLAELLDHLALMLALRGRHREAARIAGRADASVQQAGFPRQPAEARSRQRTGELLNAAMPEAELAQLLADGAALDEALAAALAMAQPGPQA